MSGTNPILGGGGFHHVCLKTARFDAAVAFYRETLGFVEKLAWRQAPERAVMLDGGDGNYIEIFEDLAYAAGPAGAVIHFALRTTRLEAVVERVRAAGAPITMEPKSVTIASTNGRGPVPVRIAFCVGPAGEVIEFFQNELT